MKEYDYQEGTVVTFAPDAEVGLNYSEDELSPDVIGILFHHDLIIGTPLDDRFAKYSFFHYSQREALHLSESEKQLFLKKELGVTAQEVIQVRKERLN